MIRATVVLFVVGSDSSSTRRRAAGGNWCWATVVVGAALLAGCGSLHLAPYNGRGYPVARPRQRARPL